ncbi:MAG: hypothetical protein QOK32_11, partial [Gaiellaceae bacterium]|nr:hypothetical protein [Gaiellaceae bacterium]
MDMDGVLGAVLPRDYDPCHRVAADTL